MSPDRKVKPKNLLTLGHLIDALRPIVGVRPHTFGLYVYALRKIAREATNQRDTSKQRFDPKSQIWRQASDMILLAKLKPEVVDAWKLKVISESGRDPVSQTRARRNVNSFIRNARALLSRKRLKKLKERGVILPEVLPFQGVELESRGSTKYHSTFNAGALLRDAQSELAGKDNDAWKVILLGLGAGLRRKEIDGLRRLQLNFDKNEIWIMNHEAFEAKTLASEDMVNADPALMAELQDLKNVPASDYVIEPGTPYDSNGTSQYYRAQRTFERVTNWLRAHGVTRQKPLHTLRKEFGSIICAAADIHTASRQLRHKHLGTTAAHYTDHRRRDTVPVGVLLTVTAPTEAQTDQLQLPLFQSGKK